MGGKSSRTGTSSSTLSDDIVVGSVSQYESSLRNARNAPSRNAPTRNATRNAQNNIRTTSSGYQLNALNDNWRLGALRGRGEGNHNGGVGNRQNGEVGSRGLGGGGEDSDLGEENDEEEEEDEEGPWKRASVVSVRPVK